MALEKEKNKTQRAVKSVIQIAISNLIKLMSGVLVGFLLPKIIGVEDYGYYKIFTLYASYIGLFQFGFIDGIYLKYGGKDYEQLDIKEFRSYSVFYILCQLFFGALVFVCSFLIRGVELKFIIICLSLFMMFSNIISYFQIVSQITNRFKELSTRNIIQSAMNICAILSLCLLAYGGKTSISYRIYTIMYVIITIILCVWYIRTYKDLVFGTRNKMDYKLFLKLVVLGLPLLFSNLCQTLILSLDRQFVSILFSTTIYAVYAFAYNMLSLITTATAAISTVLYPLLKRTDTNKMKESYQNYISIVIFIVYMCLAVYYPLVPFVNSFLPQYSQSLMIFRIILPGLGISSAVTIVMHNYYKAEGRSVEFFIKCILTVVLSVIANYLAYYMVGTPESISVASIIVMVIWFFISEEFFIRNYRIKTYSNWIYMLLMTFGFYFITNAKSWWIGLIIYLLYLFLVTLLLKRSEVKLLLGLGENNR